LPRDELVDLVVHEAGHLISQAKENMKEFGILPIGNYEK
jgi:hypothetical protein